MLISEPTPQMIEEWKQIFENHHLQLTPNRKTGIEVDNYFRNKYSFERVSSPEFKEIVERNILENEYSRKKLKEGENPHINIS